MAGIGRSLQEHHLRRRTGLIFLTVGSALPFDRLVKIVDQAVAKGNIEQRVFAQIGDGDYVPQHMEYTRFLPKPDYEAVVSSSTAIISHAGIGSIVSALKLKIPLLVLPRSPNHGELVDHHQEKTAKAFAERGHLMVFFDERELKKCLADLNDFVAVPRRPDAAGVAQAIGLFIRGAAHQPKAG